MYMNGVYNEQEHRYAEKILLEIAYLWQVQNDYLDCYGDPSITGKRGTDIQEGKCVWLIVTAIRHSNATQIEILKSNYGKDDPECVKRVKNVYGELNLRQLYYDEESKQFKKISQLIDETEKKSKLNSKIFTIILNEIYKKNKYSFLKM